MEVSLYFAESILATFQEQFLIRFKRRELQHTPTLIFLVIKKETQP